MSCAEIEGARATGRSRSRIPRAGARLNFVIDKHDLPSVVFVPGAARQKIRVIERSDEGIYAFGSPALRAALEVAQDVPDSREARAPGKKFAPPGAIEDERPIEARAPGRVGSDPEVLECEASRGLRQGRVQPDYEFVSQPLHPLKGQVVYACQIDSARSATKKPRLNRRDHIEFVHQLQDRSRWRELRVERQTQKPAKKGLGMRTENDVRA